MTMQMEMHDLREYKMRVSDDLGGVRRLFRWSCGPPRGCSMVGLRRLLSPLGLAQGFAR